MFINFWYCAARSADLADGPFKVGMLGQDFVLFRDSGGTARCLHNVCVHRGSSLADGKVKGDCIECPYHGWQYGPNGTCEHIPTLLESNSKIPKRAKVDSYPTLERYGLVFAFLGDLPEAERPPLLEVNEWEQEGWGYIQQRFEFDIYYQRSIENGLDIYHNDFVHPEFHVPDKYKGTRKVPLFDWVETEWITGFTTSLPANQPDEHGHTTIQGDAIADVDTGHHGVSSFYTYIHINEETWLHQYFWETPIDEGNTRLFTMTMRNFMIDESRDKQMEDANEFILRQDLGVIRGIQPIPTPRSNIKELLVTEDRGIARYRELVKHWEAKGWRIDVDALIAQRRESVYAIPSPARRHSKNWVIDPVPLIPPREQSRKVLSAR